MSSYLTSQQFFRLGAAAFVMFVVAIAVIQSRPSEDAAVLTRLEPDQADALVRELARCRTVTPDDASVLEACRLQWAENRLHFFAATRSQQLRIPLAPDAPSGVKSQERIPQHEIERNRSR
jgi:conjugative transfer region protein TrbK